MGVQLARIGQIRCPVIMRSPRVHRNLGDLLIGLGLTLLFIVLFLVSG
jgi:hypothetical protein